MESKWLKDSLFSGMTANGFKLGTVLTLGWFWPRVGGCSVLHRGLSIETIDFDDVLAVANTDAGQISPPYYVTHATDTTYFYVIRRANNCGYEEQTLAAAVKISIDANGDLAQAQPNSIFEARVEQAGTNKAQLVWYYCPVEQKSEPAYFKIYYDSGTGQIDYQNPLATISYAGRRFYQYRSSTLNGGRYLFAIRAEDAGGVEDSSLAQLRIQIETGSPDAIDIVGINPT